MLKMTIDNEEVVSKNDFTIKEEMLSASSTILNNTYPKSWEDDKDYTSRFYYPKDYAKLNIQNFSIEPEEAGTTIQVNGSATLTDVDTTKESRVLKLLGQTSQVSYTGKNLCTKEGENNVVIATLQSGTYTFSLKSTISGGCNLKVGGSTGATIANLFISSSSTRLSVTFTINEETNIFVNGYSTTTGTSFALGTSQWQIETGNEATSFEPYVGGIPSPNPQFPEPVNVVSGDNVLSICGVNLFDKSKEVNTTFNSSIATALSNFLSTGEYAVGYTSNGTSLSNNANYVTSFTYCVSGKTYSIKNMYVGANFSMICFLDKNGNVISHNTGWSNEPYTHTATSEEKYIMIGINTNDSGKNYLDYTMIVENEKQPTTYEPYIGQDYPIYLGVENLIPNNGTSTTTNGITFTINSDGSVKVNGTATATAYLTYPTFSLKAGTYTLGAGIFVNALTRIQLVEDITSKPLLASTQNASSQTFTITSDKNAFLQFRINSGEVIDTTFYPQLEIGDKANSFTPYGTTPIELCKIGTYQDYIYKEDGSWYLHKEIGKVVLDGSENWTNYTNLGNNSRCYYIKPNAFSLNSQLFSNYFIKSNLYETDETGIIINPYGTSLISIKIPNSDLETQDLAGYKTWLSTHNTIVYYVLATPTTEEITDTTLISQLDALESQ